ncbi:drug/metabolite exporter, drug/metabolite transporter [Plasmodium relictum]|uniref:Drug/metabolite exporter, drug/metabolite transporter n=1 Tax=Plasmodium relictum TaxID=85471 RepID=A0A1J1HAJ4_PLARL|nr:drug/metabolite exporter, drug/metabolite transporter [Plasmodium relictum]CRH02489.1 drug/metabolite exporter, drug/metabolite transporter [Plasmodium relictum]
MSYVLSDDNLKSENYSVKNEKDEKKKKIVLISVNLLLLFSMLLYGINYTLIKYFIKLNGSTYIFIILRSILTIPIMIYIYSSKKSEPKKKKLLCNMKEMVKKEKNIEKKLLLKKNNNNNLNKNSHSSNKCYDNIKHYDDDNKNNSNYMSSDNNGNIYNCEKYETCVNIEGANDHCLSQINKNDEKLIPKVAYIPMIISSVAGSLRQIIVIVALQYTDSHNVGIIQPTIPIFTALMSHYLKIEKMNYITSLSIFLSCIGLAITAEIWNIHSLDFGFLLLLTVPVTKGLQVIYINIATKYVNNNMIQFFEMIVMFFIALPFGILGEMLFKKKYNIINEIYNLNIYQFLCVIYSAIAIIFICWKIQIIALNHLTPISVSLYQSFQPCFTFILAKFFLNETIGLNKFIGTIFIVVSLLLYQYRFHKKIEA